MIFAGGSSAENAISHAWEIVPTHFLAFPTLRKPSPRIFWHFPHSVNRPHAFFAISRTREIVPTHFLAFPTLRKSSQNFFWHFLFKILLPERTIGQSADYFQVDLISGRHILIDADDKIGTSKVFFCQF